MASRRAIGSVLGLVMSLNTACYSFAPVATGVAPKSGDQVRVRLNADGTAGVASTLGPGVAQVEGLLDTANSDGSIVVGVTLIRLGDGIERYWAGQNVTTIAARFIDGVDVRTLDRQKTRAAAIGGSLAVLAIFALALSSGGVHGQPDSGTTPPPP